MRQLVLVFVLTFATLSYLPTGQGQPLPDGTLSGMVCQDTYGECWEGIPDATIKLHKAGSVAALDENHETTTDGTGHYSFSALDGEYQVTVTRSGFEALETTVTVDGDEVEDFGLTALRVNFSGTIAGPDGTPVSARIDAWGQQDWFEAKSDKNGAFQAEALAGFYEIHVRASGYAIYEERLLIDGEALAIELEAAPPADSFLQGTVRDQDGTPVPDAMVYVYQWNQYGGEQYAETGPDGAYSFEVYEGDLSLQVEKEGHRGRYDHLWIEKGDTVTHDVELLKYPEKTAKLVGRLIDRATGDPLRYASISVQNPEYGIWECSDYQGGQGDHDSSEPRPMPTEESPSMSVAPRPYYDPGCSITIHEDGTFSGMVTPGYTIITVWYDHYRTCSESSSSDGSYTRTCGQDYLGWAGTFTLTEGETKITVAMKPRASPDAIVSGYIVDGETGKAIPGARISFNNEEKYGWGDAGTDGDGSYKVRLHGGYQRVSVWAEGYLPWQGVLDVPAGGNVDLDVVLTPGDGGYGHCCYAYAHEGVAYADGDVEASGGPSPPPASGGQSSQGSTGGSDFEDLGGNLGPYDPEKRAAQLKEAEEKSKDSPGVGLLLLGALALLAYARRR